MEGLNFLSQLNEEHRQGHLEKRFVDVVSALERTTTSKEHKNVLMKKLFSTLDNKTKLSDKTEVLILMSTVKEVGDVLCKHLLNAFPYIKFTCAKKTLLSGIDLYSKQIDLAKKMNDKNTEVWYHTHFLLLILETLVWLLSIRNEVACDISRFKGNLFSQFKLKRLRKRLYI